VERRCARAWAWKNRNRQRTKQSKNFSLAKKEEYTLRSVSVGYPEVPEDEENGRGRGLKLNSSETQERLVSTAAPTFWEVWPLERKKVKTIRSRLRGKEGMVWGRREKTLLYATDRR